MIPRLLKIAAGLLLFYLAKQNGFRALDSAFAVGYDLFNLALLTYGVHLMRAALSPKVIAAPSAVPAVRYPNRQDPSKQ